MRCRQGVLPGRFYAKMATKKYKMPICLMVILLLTACQNTSNVGQECNIGCEFNDFVKLDDISRRARIVQCEPEQQVELYLAWSFHTLPSNTDYAYAIAQSGKALIPSLLTRLERREHLRDEIYKPELLIVLDIMQRAGYYHVASDFSLMTQIDNAVNQITTDYIKDWALDIVFMIKAEGSNIGLRGERGR